MCDLWGDFIPKSTPSPPMLLHTTFERWKPHTARPCDQYEILYLKFSLRLEKKKVLLSAMHSLLVQAMGYHIRSKFKVYMIRVRLTEGCFLILFPPWPSCVSIDLIWKSRSLKIGRCLHTPLPAFVPFRPLYILSEMGGKCLSSSFKGSQMVHILPIGCSVLLPWFKLHSFKKQKLFSGKELFEPSFRRWLFALFKSIFLRNQSLSNARWFYGKKTQLGREICIKLKSIKLKRNVLCCR